jgi:hypothetical protein
MQTLTNKNQHSNLLFSAELFLDTSLNPFLMRNFASYARLGPSADRRRTGVHRGSDGRPVTQQMSKRTTKNTDQNAIIMQNKPNFMPFLRPKSRFPQKTNPIQTQSNPKQTQSNPIPQLTSYSSLSDPP